MKQHTISTAQAGETPHKCVDRRGNAGDSYLVIVDMEGGSGVVSFEFTPDDCIDETATTWIEHDVLCNITDSCASTINVPFQAFRMNIKEHRGGIIKAKVVQGGYHDY